MKKKVFGNVWDALEDSTGGAANMRIRAALMMAVQNYVSASGKTQASAAKQLGVTQPRLNDLLRGRIDKFSIDALIVMLSRIGREVKVSIRKAA